MVGSPNVSRTSRPPTVTTKVRATVVTINSTAATPQTQTTIVSIRAVIKVIRNYRYRHKAILRELETTLETHMAQDPHYLMLARKVIRIQSHSWSLQPTQNSIANNLRHHKISGE